MKHNNKKLSSTKFFAILAIVLFFNIMVLNVAIAQGNEADFFKGKTMTFIVPYSPGGGFDTYSRFIAPFLEKYISGLTVVVNNMPGAGSVIGTNELYKANADGLTIGIVNVPTALYAQVGGSPGVRYDLGKFSWLTRVTAEAQVFATGSKTGINNLEDLKNTDKTLKIGVTGTGSDDHLTSEILFKALGLSMTAIAGYEGSAEVMLAILRGEVDGYLSSLSSVEQLIETKEMIPIIQIVEDEEGILEGVPRAVDTVDDASAKGLMVSITNIFALDRSLAAPPEMPEGRLEFLRNTLFDIMHDPEFLEICNKAKRPVDPLKGRDRKSVV